MLVIDRFEGEYAVCVDDTENRSRNIPKVLLPPDASAGCCLREGDGGYAIDYAATLERRAALRRRLEDLYTRN